MRITHPIGPRPGDTVLASRNVEDCTLVQTTLGGVLKGDFKVGRWPTIWYAQYYRTNALAVIRAVGGTAWETQGAIYVAVPTKCVQKAMKIME